MRIAALLLLGLVTATMSPTRAAVLSPVPQLGPSPMIVESDYRCGRHHHWVRGHHNAHGEWVHGHCRLNRY